MVFIRSPRSGARGFFLFIAFAGMCARAILARCNVFVVRFALRARTRRRRQIDQHTTPKPSAPNMIMRCNTCSRKLQLRRKFIHFDGKRSPAVRRKVAANRNWIILTLRLAEQRKATAKAKHRLRPGDKLIFWWQLMAIFPHSAGRCVPKVNMSSRTLYEFKGDKSSHKWTKWILVHFIETECFEVVPGPSFPVSLSAPHKWSKKNCIYQTNLLCSARHSRKYGIRKRAPWCAHATRNNIQSKFGQRKANVVAVCTGRARAEYMASFVIFPISFYIHFRFSLFICLCRAVSVAKGARTKKDSSLCLARAAHKNCCRWKTIRILAAMECAVTKDG